MHELKVKVVYPNLTLAQCYALHCSEHYQNKVAKAAMTTRKGESYVPEPGGGLTRRARFTYTRKIEGKSLQMMARAAMPHLGHDEYSTYNGPSGGRWRIEGGLLPLLSKCVTGQGTLTFKQKGANVHRTVRGTISCSIPGIGSLVEQQVVKRTAESLQQAAAYTPEYVRKYPSSIAPRQISLRIAADASAIGAGLACAPMLEATSLGSSGSSSEDEPVADVA